MSEATEGRWEESDSEHFIEWGWVLTPDRDDITDAVLELLPAEAEERFVAVDLCCGAGWLSEAVLRRFPQARIIALDGSETMLRHTERLLQPFAGRFELGTIRLEDRDWRRALPNDIRGVLSSLAIHHLDGPGKKQLYADVYERLADGGALLIADLIAPTSEWHRRYLAHAWDTIVRRQSLDITGDMGAYEQFVNDEWNYFEYPDPFDKPSKLQENLQWLQEAGFNGVDCFWLQAGHAVYGGYKV